ncbi:MAG: TlpA disulfide reductase family protein [Planctomycetota bacterium]
MQRLNGILLVWGLLLLTPVMATASPKPLLQPGSSQSTVETELQGCVDLAKTGDVEKAFRKVQQIRSLYGSTRLFESKYINTLVTIETLTDSELDASLLNDAVELTTEIRQTSLINAKIDAEAGYFYMLALGRLSEAISVYNPAMSERLKIQTGQIAVDLKKNPAFPRAGIEALANPLFGKFEGHAFRGEVDESLTALYSAIDAGFSDFKKLESGKYLKMVRPDQDQASFVLELKTRYQQAMDQWARTVVQQFQPFYFDFNLTGVNGDLIARSNFAGKILVVDLWATWCQPCQKSVPHYIQLQNRMSNQDVQVIGVSMDNPKDPLSARQTVQKFLTAKKLNYPCAMGDLNFKNSIPGQQALPTTLFIDKNGMVRFIARGYHDFTKLESLTKILAQEGFQVNTGPIILGN